MSSDGTGREREIFEAVLRAQPGERDGLIRARCAGAPELERRVRRLLAAHGDSVEVDGDRVTQASWRLMRGLEAESVPEWFDGILGLWQGVTSMVDRDTHVVVDGRLDRGDPAFVWQFGRSRPPRGY